MVRLLNPEKLKFKLVLVCLMLSGCLLNLSAAPLNSEGEVVVVHTDTPKSSTTTSGSRHAPKDRNTKTVYLEFLHDVDDVTIVINVSGQNTKTITGGDILSSNEIPVILSYNSGEVSIEVYSIGVLIEVIAL